MHDIVVLIIKKNIILQRLKNKPKKLCWEACIIHTTSSGKQSFIFLTRKLCFGSLPNADIQQKPLAS